VFTTAQVRERVYQNHPLSESVFICYCFRHTLGSIKNATGPGRAAILEDINAGVQSQLCACDLRNPQGTCCLGNVRALLQDLAAAEPEVRPF
jgi:hypothetical protein